MLILTLFLYIATIVALPLPRIVTRWHTAPAVTSTALYTTGTTTVWLPPVEIFISDDKTYTFTLSSAQWQTTPVTTTSYAAGQQTEAPEPIQHKQDSPDITSSNAQQTQNAPAPQTSSSAPQTSAAPPAATSSTDTFSTASPSSTALDTTAPASSYPDSAAPEALLVNTANDAPSSTAPQETTETTDSGETAQTTAQSTAQTTAQTDAQTHETTAQTEQTHESAAQTETATSTLSASSTSTSTSSTQSFSVDTIDGYSFAKSLIKIATPGAIVYSPYANDGSCKNKNSIESDLKFIKNLGISNIRVYGVDCLTVEAVLPAASAQGIKVNQGFYITNGVDSIDQDVSNIIKYGQQNGWSVFDYFTVGNEAVNDGKVSVSDLSSKISLVKSQLKNAGYNGQITTSEPPATFISHPELCTDSEIDFVGINPHSYFNTNLYAHQSGEYVTKQQKQVANLCSKKAVITETGYPSRGQDNGNNSPSLLNQFLAIKSIIDETNGDCTILSTYNDLWKNPGPHGIEQYFGVAGFF